MRNKKLRYTSVFSVLNLLLGFLLLSSCENRPTEKKMEEIPEKPSKAVPSLRYTLHRTLKHDTTSYTQGLVVVDGQLFESTGSPVELLQTRSLVGKLDTSSGKIKIGAELDRKRYFGEGITILNNKLYQLTYKNQTGFIYDAKTFKSLGQFGYRNKEGWGLTNDGKNLIMSDGSSNLTYLEPENFSVVKTIEVTNKGYTEEYLNELEFANGHVFANVYGKNYIVRIDTASGEVNGILDLSALVSKAAQRSKGSEVLNGIAFNNKTGRWYLTGKLWPVLYEIEILD